MNHWVTTLKKKDRQEERRVLIGPLHSSDFTGIKFNAWHLEKDRIPFEWIKETKYSRFVLSLSFIHNQRCDNTYKRTEPELRKAATILDPSAKRVPIDRAVLRCLAPAEGTNSRHPRPYFFVSQAELDLQCNGLRVRSRYFFAPRMALISSTLNAAWTSVWVQSFLRPFLQCIFRQ